MLTMPNVTGPKGSLGERAMLAKLSIKYWTTRKFDENASNQIADIHGAQHDAGRFSKLLLPKHALRRLDTVCTMARTTFKFHTVPWMDEGTRILSVKGYEPLTQKFRLIKNDWEQATKEFLGNFMSLKDQRQRELGTLYNEADYPTLDQLKTRFAMELRLMPVEDAEDFRAKVSDEQAAMIRASIEQATRNALAVAAHDTFGRIAEVTTHVFEKLTKYNPEAPRAEQGVFRDSLIENVRELAMTLPTLNILDDPRLTEIGDRMMQRLCAIEAGDLREDAAARAEVAKQAEAILADVSALM